MREVKMLKVEWKNPSKNICDNKFDFSIVYGIEKAIKLVASQQQCELIILYLPLFTYMVSMNTLFSDLYPDIENINKHFELGAWRI